MGGLASQTRPRGAAANIDDVLFEAVTEKIEGVAGRNCAKDIKREGMTGVRVGGVPSIKAVS